MIGEPERDLHGMYYVSRGGSVDRQVPPLLQGYPADGVAQLLGGVIVAEDLEDLADEVPPAMQKGGGGEVNGDGAPAATFIGVGEHGGVIRTADQVGQRACHPQGDRQAARDRTVAGLPASGARWRIVGLDVPQRPQGPHPHTTPILLGPVGPLHRQSVQVDIRLEQLLGQDDCQRDVVIVGGLLAVLSKHLVNSGRKSPANRLGCAQEFSWHTECVTGCVTEKRAAGASGEIRSCHVDCDGEIRDALPVPLGT